MLPLLLILACPAGMILMMRGMQGGHGHGGRHAPPDEPQPPRETMSLDELKRERDELNALIGERAERVAESEAVE